MGKILWLVFWWRIWWSFSWKPWWRIQLLWSLFLKKVEMPSGCSRCISSSHPSGDSFQVCFGPTQSLGWWPTPCEHCPPEANSVLQESHWLFLLLASQRALNQAGRGSRDMTKRSGSPTFQPSQSTITSVQCSLATKKTLRFARNKIYLMLMYTRSSSWSDCGFECWLVKPLWLVRSHKPNWPPARLTVASLSTCVVPWGRYTEGDRKLFQFWLLQLIILYNWTFHCLEEKLSA